MSIESSLYERTTNWVTQNYSNAEHLVKTDMWLLRLQPEASEALRLAALTHDMERAFPGPDSPTSQGGVDHAYNRAHAARSATVVGVFLREQGAADSLIEKVMALVCVHEDGGWSEANLLQAADSLSFLEVNIPLFLRSIGKDDDGRKREQVRAKFNWMYERIQVPVARELATSLHEAAIEALEHYIA